MNTAVEFEATPLCGGWEQIDLYRFFAHVLASPTQEKYELLHSAEFAASLRQLWQELKCEGESPDLAGFRSFAQYEAAYIALFDVGAPEPPVPLVESAHHKAIPAQQIALENVLFYEVLGLKVDTTHSFADHLLTQLEFLSAVRFAGDQAGDAEGRANLTRLERDFLQRHLLNWIPAAETKLRRLNPPIFPALFRLLVAFLQKRLHFLSHGA
jgi:DMSO reductase family type II enzyme chaperone